MNDGDRRGEGFRGSRHVEERGHALQNHTAVNAECCFGRTVVTGSDRTSTDGESATEGVCGTPQHWTMLYLAQPAGIHQPCRMFQPCQIHSAHTVYGLLHDDGRRVAKLLTARARGSESSICSVGVGEDAPPAHYPINTFSKSNSIRCNLITRCSARTWG